MNNYIQDKGVDLLVGVFATFAAATIIWIVTQLLVPLLRRILSDDVDPAGRWLGRLATHDSTYTHELLLESHFRYWKGSASIIRQLTAIGDYRHQFSASATRRGSYMLLNLLGKKECRGSIATGLFLLQARGNVLTGSWVYRPGGSELPKSESLVFNRI